MNAVKVLDLASGQKTRFAAEAGRGTPRGFFKNKYNNVLVTGSTYVVQWSRTTLDGVPVSADRIQGLLDFDARENVLASEPAYIRDQVEPSTPAPDACASFFVLVRVPADADCAEINEQRETLFPELLAQ